jgi:hypothetical protein
VGGSVLTWAEADGHNPWNMHFRAFSMVFCALHSFARLAQLFCVLSGLFGPLKCICVCGWGGRNSTRLSDPYYRDVAIIVWRVNGSHSWPLVPEYEQDSQTSLIRYEVYNDILCITIYTP